MILANVIKCDIWYQNPVICPHTYTHSSLEIHKTTPEAITDPLINASREFYVYLFTAWNCTVRSTSDAARLHAGWITFAF